MSRVLHIVSGIPPGPSGTGRLIQHLVATRSTQSQWRVRFHYPLRPSGSIRQRFKHRQYWQGLCELFRVKLSLIVFRLTLLRLRLLGGDELLVFHPQTIGFDRTLALLTGWRGRAHLYGLDNSFFCVRSYNHVDGEAGACTRCLDIGFDAAKRMGCQPFPVPDPRAFRFVRVLTELVRTGKVGVLVQNARNAELYRRVVGDAAMIEVVGLWTADWRDLAADPEWERTDGAGGGKAEPAPYDVVYHGHFVSAKGADWMLAVARALPETSFLFPCPCPRRVADPPPNITFKPMSWESGLAEQVAAARLVAVPSLWSATIEGALVKSLAFGRATARVDIPTSFGDELPDRLVLDLHRSPERAAAQLREALADTWTPDSGLQRSWLDGFKEENYDVLGRILRAIERSVKGGTGRSTAADARSPQAVPEAPTTIADPMSGHGLRLEKLGSPYGGWTVPIDPIDENWVCYCVGVGEDISFDCALVERFGCSVYAFDPTPRAIAHVEELERRVRAGVAMPINNKPGTHYEISPDQLDRLHFAPYGVWSENTTQRFFAPKNKAHVSHSIVNLQKTDDYFTAECRTLASLMAEHNHDRIDLLKLDVEGAEYEILEAMLRDGVRPKVLGIEFDEGNQPLDSGANTRIADWVKRLLDADFKLVERDGWNFVFVDRAFLDTLASAQAHGRKG
jgi:FkbM family methyltransferase